MSQRILITGSSGFLGSELCKVLSNTENIITAVDIKTPPMKYKNCSYYSGSIEKFLSENQKLSEFDLIIHTASVLPYKGNKKELIKTNIESTQNLVNKVRELKSTFFIYVSSSGVYGKPKKNPINKDTKFNPLDLYANTKIISEKYILKNIQKSKFSIIRPRTILGNNRGGIFNIFFALIKKGIPIPIPNNGKQIIQFVDVEDLANLIVYLGVNKTSGIWPAAAPKPIPLKNHLDFLGKKLGKRVLTFNVNSRIFLYIGNILVTLKLTNFTKWHFGAFPYSFYFDTNWKPQGFEYKYSCNDTFMKSANLLFDKNLE
ncbi:NAD(P)-dependent oxidoreductase [Acidimicrobiaceae bacterium]|nr:NAD(P)-dependent oxidoreductase [Acidimicrobiaceae bacterium]